MRRLDKTALLLAALGLLLALPVLTYPLGRDQGMYANIAQAIRAGGLPFIDMWDIKPPAIYYLYAGGISLFGATSVALRSIDLLAAPLILFALYHLTDAFAGRGAARWAMLLFPVFYFTETFASLTQSDSLVLVPMTWAVFCAIRAGQFRAGSRRALAWTFACGFFCAVVMLFKHYYVLFAVVISAAHLWTRLRAARWIDVDMRGLRYEIGAFTAGGLIFGIPVLAYFSTSGILSEMLTIAQGTSQYNLDALRSLSAFWEQMDSYVEFRWWHWGPLLVLAASNVVLNLLNVTTLTPDPSPSGRGETNDDSVQGALSGADFTPQPPTPSLSRGEGEKAKISNFSNSFLVIWILAGLVFVVIQAKGFDTHWLPLLPPLVMLAARALDRWLALAARAVASAAPRWNRATAASLAAVTVVFFGAILAKDTWARAWPYLTGQQGQRGYYGRFQAGDLNAGDSLRMATWLQRRTDENDSVYIWGFRPEVAFMAGLRPATRFQAQFPLVGDRYPQAWNQENVDALWAALPDYVIVVRADYMSWVTGSTKDSNTILAEDYQELRNWLIHNYDRDRELGNFLIWRRKT